MDRYQVVRRGSKFEIEDVALGRAVGSYPAWGAAAAIHKANTLNMGEAAGLSIQDMMPSEAGTWSDAPSAFAKLADICGWEDKDTFHMA